MKPRIHILSLSLLGTAILGCGGGSGAGSASNTPGGPENSTAVGMASIRYIGQVKPLVSSTVDRVTVAGLTGAAFNNITTNPAPLLAATELAYVMNGQLWCYSFLTHQSRQITHIPGAGNSFTVFTRSPAWKAPGVLSYESAENLTTATTLYLVTEDGLQTVKLTGPVVDKASWSPDGSKVAGVDNSGNLVVMNANGSNPITLDTAANLTTLNCSWLGSSSIAYGRLYMGFTFLYTVPATGGTPLLFGGGSSSGAVPIYVSAFPDQSGIAYSYPSSSPTTFITNAASGYSQIITPSGYTDRYPSVAPDNATMAVWRQHGTSFNDGISGIYTMTIDGDNPTPIVLDPSSSNQLQTISLDLAWSPFPKARQFVGPSGVAATNSSGFLIGEASNVFTSFFSFVATTPSSAVITPSTNSGTSAPLVFTVTADAISSIVYTNGYYFNPVKLTPGTGTNGIVVSFDSAYGQIGLVAPAAQTRDGRKLTRVQKGDHVLVTGNFPKVMDGSGKLLKTGVTTIELDSKTGKLIQMQ